MEPRRSDQTLPMNGKLAQMHVWSHRRRWTGYSALLAWLMVGWLSLASCPVLASSVPPTLSSATLTADNHYALYVGNEDGSVLTYVGRNEATVEGNPGQFNWSLPETFDLNIAPGQYIYVVAWDETANPASPQMWIGQFSFPDGSKLYSNLADWSYTVGSGPNPGDGSDPPAIATISGDIAAAVWTTPTASVLNGTGPWGTIPGFDPAAQFIWADGLDLEGNPTNTTNDKYVIFRSQTTFVPAPASVLLLGSGLLRLGLLGLRRRKS